MAEIFTKKGVRILVDDGDFDRLNAFPWHLSQGYVYRNAPHPTIPGKRFKQSMHREVFGLSFGDDIEVDHRDGNKLDNRRLNLRCCDHAKNCMNKAMSSHNTSGFKGVSYSTTQRKWRAQIQVNRKSVILGSFDSPEQAHQAYCQGAQKYHGEFARP